MGLYKFALGLCSVVLKIMFNVKVAGLENIPKDKNFILVSNHISNFDPIALGVAVKEPLAFMGKEELFKNKLFGGLLKKFGAFPVSRGSGDLGAIKTALRILKDGKNMVMFPEGTRSKTKGMMRKGKSGAVMLASKVGCGLLPAGISAEYKFRGKVTITFGEYIDFSEYKSKKLSAEELQAMTDEILMPQIASLAGVKVYANNNSR